MADIEWLLRAIGRDPQRDLALDLERLEARFGDRVIPVRMPDGSRSQLVSGTWDATGLLLEAGDAIEGVAQALPYVRGF